MADNYIDVTLSEIFGTGVASVEQTETSAEPGGYNVWTITLTNGHTSTFTVRNGTAGGSPMPVLNSVDMTDTTGIYLYLGNEEGFVTGHWYCYANDAWTDYGAYSEKGDPGLAPTVEVSKTGGTTTITITDAEGEHVATIEDGISPTVKVANTAADMTDTSLIYVYAGSEAAYNNGDWYIYDSYINQWRSGGTYQASVPRIDQTLTVQGAAADSAKVGQELSDLKSEIDNINIETDTTLSIVGKPADAKSVGDAINNIDVESQIAQYIEDHNIDGVTEEEIRQIVDDYLGGGGIADAVNAWLNDHPEATTTVQDGSITEAKLSASVIDNMNSSLHGVDDIRANIAEFDISNSFIFANTANAPSPLTIPTPYVGNEANQLCHPKVLFLKNKFGGHYFWMAFTPYPFSADAKENPCIVCSDDLINWSVPDGFTNPLAPTPSRGYNSDTHLVYREDLRRLECWYRRYEGDGTTETILRRTTTDGVNWTEAETLFQIGSAESGFANLLCPVAIYDQKAKKYRIWASDNTVIRYYESNDGSNWQYVATTNLVGWHFDIIESDLGYEAFVHDSQQAETISYSTSSDCVTWTAKQVILRASNGTAWDDGYLYRSSAFKHNGIYYLYYTGITNISSYSTMEWRVGLTITQEKDNISSFKGYSSGTANVDYYYDNNSTDTDAQARISALETTVSELEEKVDALEDVIYSAQSIEVTPSTAQVSEGLTVQLSAVKTPFSAETEWVSSDENIATVNENGLATGVSTGIVNIINRGVRNPNVSDTCVLTVKGSNILEGLHFNTGYINGSDGSVVAGGGSNEVYSDPLSISNLIGNRLLFIYGSSALAKIRLAYYDANNALIGSVYTKSSGAKEFDMTVPSGASTMRIGCASDETSIMAYAYVQENIDFSSDFNYHKYYDASDGVLKTDNITNSKMIDKVTGLMTFSNFVSGALFDSNDSFISGIAYKNSDAERRVNVSSASKIGINYNHTKTPVVLSMKTIGIYQSNV